jgi:hypothetical protein
VSVGNRRRVDARTYLELPQRVACRFVEPDELTGQIPGKHQPVSYCDSVCLVGVSSQRNSTLFNLEAHHRVAAALVLLEQFERFDIVL